MRFFCSHLRLFVDQRLQHVRAFHLHLGIPNKALHRFENHPDTTGLRVRDKWHRQRGQRNGMAWHGTTVLLPNAVSQPS